MCLYHLSPYQCTSLWNLQGPIFTQPILALEVQCTDNLKHWGSCTLESMCIILPTPHQTGGAIGLLLAGSAFFLWGFAYHDTALRNLTAALDELVFPTVSHFSDLSQVISVFGQCAYRQRVGFRLFIGWTRWSMWCHEWNMLHLHQQHWTGVEENLPKFYAPA